jgi:hypothetical protein
VVNVGFLATVLLLGGYGWWKTQRGDPVNKLTA